MEYEKPKMEVIIFERDNIIMTSGLGENDNPDNIPNLDADSWFDEL